MQPLRLKITVSIFLILSTLVVYWQVWNHDFLNFDDAVYVTENHRVQAGLTFEGLVWAFATTDAEFYHPLTWVSHMLDCHLFGLNPGFHHVTNLLLHLANTLLLFAVFKKMTKDFWPSAFVAALFALHPLHVESVAWVAERKDVLSTFFWFLTMLSYTSYVERPSLHRYSLILFFYGLGLLSKPMLVTLPFVLLLMDYWPLDRFEPRKSVDSNDSPTLILRNIVTNNYHRQFIRLVWEKFPLFAFSAASCILTYFAQQKGGTLASLETYTLGKRIANALVSYVDYIIKMMWPHNLAALYPLRDTIPLWQIITAFLFIGSMSILVGKMGRRHGYLLTGWLWYLGTLVPVIGLVQVGIHAMADRYTYIPINGLFIMVSWGIPKFLKKIPHRNVVLGAAASAVIIACTITTYLQVGYWRNSFALFEHTLRTTSNNYLAHNNFGLALKDQGRLSEAIEHYSEALRIRPDYVQARINLGVAFGHQGRLSEAIEHFSEALRIKPRDKEALINLGVALVKRGRTEEAIEHLLKVLQLDPDNVEAHNNLAVALLLKGDIDGAIAHFKKVLQMNPDHTLAKNSLKRALMIKRQNEEGTRGSRNEGVAS